jgi:UPF0716 family protein affecting phage T7 exclusion
MWGIWTLVIVAFVGVVFLGIALAVGAAPLLAILIFVLAAAAIGVGFVFKRGTEYVKARDAKLEAGGPDLPARAFANARRSAAGRKGPSPGRAERSPSRAVCCNAHFLRIPSRSV